MHKVRRELITLPSRADAPMRRALVYPVIGAVCGAWLGAVPNSIHWDRPWQVRPPFPGMIPRMTKFWFRVTL